MYREVDIKEAVMAALEGRTVFGLNPLVPEDTYNLTKQIEDLVKDGDRFIIDEPEAILLSAEEPKPKKKKTNRGGSRKKADLDIGKVLALHNAGWSNRKIGDEMGVSDTCVAKYLDQALEDETLSKSKGADNDS